MSEKNFIPAEQVSEATWIQMKKDYEAGSGSNVSDKILAAKYNVSEYAIRARREKGKWKKGSLLPKIEETIEKQFLKQFEKLDIDKEQIATIVADMMVAKKEAFSGKEVADYGARSKALDHYKDFTGTKAAQKQELKTHSTIDVNIRKKTDDELAMELNRLRLVEEASFEEIEDE